MAKIVTITFYWKDNFVNFSDTDTTTDYFHSYSLGQKETAEWINEKGADIITTRTVNNDVSIPTLKRVKQLCKKAGYEYTDKSHMHKYYGMRDTEAFVIEYELRRVKSAGTI